MSHTPQSGPMKTFLRGGQVTLHTLRMFGQVIRFIGFAMISVMILITYFGVMANTQPDERHYAMKYYEAWGYYNVVRNPDLELNMLMSNGEYGPFPVTTILSNSAVQSYEKSFRKTFSTGSFLAALEVLLGSSQLSHCLFNGAAISPERISNGARKWPRPGNSKQRSRITTDANDEKIRSCQKHPAIISPTFPIHWDQRFSIQRSPGRLAQVKPKP